MTPRLRMVAGPNGSGKTTLMRRLAADYAVNFYDVINADDIFAEVSRTGAYAPHMSLLDGILRSYAETTSYPEDVKSLFRDGSITLESDLIRFAPDAVNSYTVALVAILSRPRVRSSMLPASRTARRSADTPCRRIRSRRGFRFPWRTPQQHCHTSPERTSSTTAVRRCGFSPNGTRKMG